MDVVIAIFITVLGFILGSFYACIGYRIPNKISIVKPNSHCDNCKKELKWYMNIPLLSYIFLGGKCSYCKTKIGPLNFLVELTTGLLFLLSYLLFGISFEFFILITLISAFSITIISDYYYYYISDRVVYISFGAILLLNLIYFGTYELFISLIGGLLYFGILYLIKIIGDKLLKKESLGGGDIKLMLVIGSSLGIYNTTVGLLIASILALLFSLILKLLKKEKDLIPFGPFLLIGAITAILFQISII